MTEWAARYNIGVDGYEAVAYDHWILIPAHFIRLTKEQGEFLNSIPYWPIGSGWSDDPMFHHNQLLKQLDRALCD